MRIRTAHGLAILLSIVSLGAAQGPISSGSTNSRYEVAAKTVFVPQTTAHKAYQVGIASWYGEDFQGKETASGESYNMYELTAAHPTLPLGSHVRVTNLRTGRAVVVRINDRGPVVPGRIIDLSYGAAKVLGYKARGLQRVRLDVVKQQHQPQTMAMLRPLVY